MNATYVAGESPRVKDLALDDQSWDTLESRWRALKAIAAADYEFGSAAKASEAWQDEKHRIARLPRLEDTQRRAMLDAAYRKVTDAQNASYIKFGERAEEAAMAMVLTPAPTFAAIVTKIEAIEHHELKNLLSMPRDPMSIIVDDLNRLDGEA